MEKDKIEAIKYQQESKSVIKIELLLDFTNYYKKFIKNFKRIEAQLISML